MFYVVFLPPNFLHVPFRRQWKKNIHRALELHQTLHVFYFEGRRGLGKLSWDELGDQAAKDRARKNGGLGASQTAEVAYLDKWLRVVLCFWG